MKTNNDIRTTAKGRGVRLWEIADRLNMADTTMSRKLRRELPADEKQRILTIIDEIAREKENAVQSATNTLNG